MARPERNNVDYFPFYCEEGKKMYYLEETYGNDGFAVFVKILRELAKTDYHYLDLSKNTTMMFLSAKCKVDKKILESIINDLVELEKFDSVLWNENKIIWCQDFINSIQDAYIKRKNKCITYDGLLLLLISLGVRKPNKSKSIDTVNTQTKVKKTKEEEIKVTFEIFWITYHDITDIPKTDKEPAFKKWKILNDSERLKAVKKIHNYYNSLEDKKYCKKARTYLNDKTFNDEFKTTIVKDKINWV
jgi:hypothetical protein